MGSHDLSIMVTLVVLITLIATWVTVFQADEATGFQTTMDSSYKFNTSKYPVTQLNVSFINQTSFPGGQAGKGVALLGLGAGIIGMTALIILTWGLATPIAIGFFAAGGAFAGIGGVTLVDSSGVVDIPLVSEFWGGINYLGTGLKFISQIVTFDIPATLMPPEISIFVSLFITIPIIFVFFYLTIRIIRGIG